MKFKNHNVVTSSKALIINPSSNLQVIGELTKQTKFAESCEAIVGMIEIKVMKIFGSSFEPNSVYYSVTNFHNNASRSAGSASRFALDFH